MRRNLFLATMFASLMTISSSRAIEPTVVLDLWPGKPPGETKSIPEESLQPVKPGQLAVKRVANVSKPQLAIFKAKENPMGTMVLIAPGGGYNILAIEHEGEEAAAWLNSIGISAAVLKYRIPRREKPSPEALENWAQLQDAQRALGTLRAKASDWGVRPDNIGVLGFSAGGNLMGTLCTNFEKRAYEPVDATDTLSCRPAFAILVYPAYLAGKDGKLKPEYPVSKQTPPMFFAHASDDNVSSENSIALYRALRASGVPAELHLYASGGHGFGLRPGRGPASEWPKRCEHWLKAHGWAK